MTLRAQRSESVLWPVVVQVVEKAIGVTHIEMKPPACCTAAQKSFLNLQDCTYTSSTFMSSCCGPTVDLLRYLQVGLAKRGINLSP